MIAVSVTNLTKRYGRAKAVDDVSFKVESGEIVGFLGPNGAGKTTTLRMLAGLVRPSSGACQLLGQPVPGPTLRTVGTMIEEPSFYPYLSGRDNLRHAARLHGGVTDQRVDESLEFVKLDNAADKRVKAYSQGMRQRLALARAVLWHPKVLLLDEPTNGLDPSGIAEFRESIRALVADGATVLVSSHILAEVEKLADRVLAIDKGQLRFDGRLSDLLARAGDQLVRYLIHGTDGTALLAALARLGYQAAAHGVSGAELELPLEEADELLSRLAAEGVRVVSAQRHTDNLEDAYLRLVGAAGRPT